MTTNEASGLIGCSPQQVRTLIKEGKLKAAKVEVNGIRNRFVYDVDEKDAERIACNKWASGWPRGKARRHKRK